MRRFALTVLLLSIFCSGCGYGDVSPKTYELATSLYNVSNRKLTGKLEAVTEQIESAQEQEEITAKEAGWLVAIVEQAQAENWDKAMKNARRIMEDQVSQ